MTPQRKIKRPRIQRQVTVDQAGRPLAAEEAAAIRLEISQRFRSSQERREQVRALARKPDAEDIVSVRFAMRAVERQIVRGLWVLEISQAADGPRRQSQHGIGYIPEDIDHYGTVASGGKWEPSPARDALPTSREIDAAREAQTWISWLDEGQARLLTVAAMTKRGDRANRVNWAWVKARLRLPDGTKMRTLQHRYDRALRLIVAELTVCRAAV